MELLKKLIRDLWNDNTNHCVKRKPWKKLFKYPYKQTKTHYMEFTEAKCKCNLRCSN